MAYLSRAKRSLGWIPFKKNAIQVEGETASYMGHKYKLWLSRPIEGRILSGSFSQDAQGHWYINIACEISKQDHKHAVEDVGGDPGLKTSMTFSDGSVIENTEQFKELEEALAKAQRAHQKRKIKKIHAKIKNRRKDFVHKETTQVARKYYTLYIGNVSGKFVQSGNGKSSADASIGIIRSLLKYKTIRYSGRYYEVNESSSTVACSHCHKKTGPSGLSDLGVREWICSVCHAHHDRDINAAMNILRFGRESLRAAKVA